MSGSLFDNASTSRTILGATSPVEMAAKYQDWQNAQASNDLIRANTANAQQNLQNLQSSNALTQQNTINAQTTNQRDVLSLGTESQAAIARSVMALGADPDNLTSSSVHAAIQQAGQAGHINPAIIQAWQNNVDAVPTDATGKPTAPGGYAPLLQHALLYAANPDLYAKLTTPGTGTYETGKGLQGYSANPPIGTGAPGQVTPQGGTIQGGLLSGAAGSQRVAGPPTATGQATTVPLASVTPPALGGIAPPQQGGTPVLPQGGVANPRLGVPPTIPGQVATSLPTETEAALSTSAKLLAADDVKAGTFATDKIPYEQAMQIYNNGITTSPTAAWFNRVKQALRANLPAGVTSDMVDKGDFDALNKWNTQIAINQSGASNSVPALEAALTGNASTHINENAGADVTRIGLGVLRMQQAINTQYHTDVAAGKFTGTYSQYKRDAANNLDPRAFIYDTMAPAQKAKMQDIVKGMSGPAGAKWDYSYGLAKQVNGSQAVPE